MIDDLFVPFNGFKIIAELMPETVESLLSLNPLMPNDEQSVKGSLSGLSGKNFHLKQEPF